MTPRRGTLSITLILCEIFIFSDTIIPAVCFRIVDGILEPGIIPYLSHLYDTTPQLGGTLSFGGNKFL